MDTNFDLLGKDVDDTTFDPELDTTMDSDTKNENNSLAPEPEKEVYGVVCDCSNLNVREKPGTYSRVLLTIPVSTNVLINLADSTDDFYKITTEFGVEGYCMKLFIKN